MVTINPKKYEVKNEDIEVPLTITEFRILMLLAGNNLILRDEIAEKVYCSWDKEACYYIISTAISRMRKKLKCLGLNISIDNIRPYGYRLIGNIYIDY